jgi:hypothetical protein
MWSGVLKSAPVVERDLVLLLIRNAAGWAGDGLQHATQEKHLPVSQMRAHEATVTHRYMGATRLLVAVTVRQRGIQSR